MSEYLAILLTKEKCDYMIVPATLQAEEIASFFNREISAEIAAQQEEVDLYSSYLREREQFFRLDQWDSYFIIWPYSEEKKLLLESLVNGLVKKSGSFQYNTINFLENDFLIKEDLYSPMLLERIAAQLYSIIDSAANYPTKYNLRKILKWNTYKSGWGYGVQLFRDGGEGWMDFRGFFLAYLRGTFGKRYYPITLLTHPDYELRKYIKQLINRK